jgi:hypothetical protein
MIFTAEETAIEFPVGCTVVFRGYDDDEVKGMLRVGQTLKVVGHDTSIGFDGLTVVSARGDRHHVFATEVVHACHLCDGPEPDGHKYCEACSVFQCDRCGEVDVSSAEVEGGRWMCDCCVEATGKKLVTY